MAAGRVLRRLRKTEYHRPASRSADVSSRISVARDLFRSRGRTMGIVDLIIGGKGLRKPKGIRHQGKRLSEILEAHKNHFTGEPGGKRADLRDADLRLADLPHANLTGAILEGAKLEGADLRQSKLTRASLAGARLRGADLRNTDLTEADLRGADLSEAQ